MKAAEILRKLADVIDQQSGEESRPSNSVPHAELEPVDVDNTDNTETATMIAPLQQKLELMKKSAGVKSAYDEEPEEYELAILKRQAGLTSAIADEDEPLEG
jgi:hypothetical protein